MANPEETVLIGINAVKRFDILQGLYDTAWRPMLKNYVELEQELAGFLGDTDAIECLTNQRAFIKNTGGSPAVFTYGGQPITFTNGGTYCVSPNEAAIFMKIGADKGFTFALVDITEYLSTGFVGAFFE